ncbi:MAG: ImmA/IrrE family metallo-endopeptidase [Dehalococcoidales bacterium]|nr:ImmA/IrrE family metallo-endopeptidase [Dehalococcoidales bacterium]
MIKDMTANFQEAASLIIEKARSLASQGMTEKGNAQPPFLLENLARIKGVSKIEEADLSDTSAILMRCQEGYIIKVNKNHHPVRQRFSCAHEIGHLLFDDLRLEGFVSNVEHRTSNPHIQTRPRDNVKERLCDIAATELLMPESVFRKYLANVGVSVNSVERLAHTFGVSIPSSAIRITEVSLEGCLALLWQPRLRRKGAKMLKLAWCVGPGPSFSTGGRYTLIHDKVTPPSMLHKAYEQDFVVKCFKKFRHGDTVKPLAMESKGFGYHDMRYVISLAFLKDDSVIENS